jgi:hypothetical protein
MLPLIPAMRPYFEGNDNRSPEERTTQLLQSVFKTDASNAYEYWSTRPELERNFTTFMDGKFSPNVPAAAWTSLYPYKERIIDKFDVKSTSPIFVDVGGNKGHEAERFLNLLRDETGDTHTPDIYVQDLVIPDTRSQNQKIKYMDYNFFTPQPVRDSCVYFFANIFHNWSDERCRELLANLKGAMRPNYSKLLISDYLVPATGCPFAGFAMDLSMMILHSGKERTLKQWNDLLSSEGFTYNDHWVLPDGRGIIEAMVKTS